MKRFMASTRSNEAFLTRLPLILPAVSCRQLDGTQADISECLKFAKAMPTITQRCQLPCQDDCQLTNWSKFSSCTADCVGVRTRKRALIGGNRERHSTDNGLLFETFPDQLIFTVV